MLEFQHDVVVNTIVRLYFRDRSLSDPHSNLLGTEQSTCSFPLSHIV